MKPKTESALRAASAPVVESLEYRRLLAAALGRLGDLSIQGTTGNDTITIAPSASGTSLVVSINGTNTSFNRSAVKSIFVDAAAGNDTVTVAAAVTTPASFFGGPGNDSLVGGGGDDTFRTDIAPDGADTMKGGGGNDTIDYSTRTTAVTVGLGTLSDDGAAGEKDNAWNDVETVIGGSGNDNLKGTAANNLLIGNGGNDTLQGLGGNDTLSGNAGADSLDGGDGTDLAVNSTGDAFSSVAAFESPTAVVQNRKLVITGTRLADSIRYITDEPDVVVTLQSDGREFTFNRADFDSIEVRTLTGNDRVDAIRSGGDSIPALVDLGDGSDHVELDAGAVSVLGGAGNDSVSSDSTTPDGFDGGSGVDQVYTDRTGALVDLRLYPGVEVAGAFSGKIIGNALDNYLWLNNSTGTLQGMGGNDTLSAEGFGAGDELGATLEGGDGNDLLLGSRDNDLLRGGAGSDTLDGDDGDDTLDGGTGADVFRGGFGNDTADYSSRTGNLTIGLGTAADDGEANEKDNVSTDIETILGGSGNDTISAANAGTAANLIVGNGGNDSLRGGAGNDTLSGDAGADTLNGEAGTDTALNAAGDTLVSVEFIGGSSGGDARLDPRADQRHPR